MSTDLATLLGKRGQTAADDDSDNERQQQPDADEPQTKRKRGASKTREEKAADEAQRELFFEEKYRCDFETYTVVGAETRVSRINPAQQVVVLRWLDNKCPPPDVLAQMGQATQRLAIASRGGVQGERGWHDERDERCVTSSMLARALAMAEPHVSGDQRVAQSQQLMLEQAKLRPKFDGNALTEHGARMEPFARKVYMQERARQPVIQIGFISHPSNTLCGASPDGIVLDGSRLVELKCPAQRYFQEGDPTPLGYWHQIRFQMEVCAAATATPQQPDGLVTHCDYFECRHMRRPRGLRTNCVDVRRDKQWFPTVEPVIEQYYVHLQRLRRLRALYPSHLFEAPRSNAERTMATTTAAATTATAFANTLPKLFRAVALQD